ncbi:hypothetical protein B4119_1609 [Parageobacillus caldoxylosilyticus]|uniref:Uncharacterized protein n=1 Tax=Saccharococcus caldoxylosilyticus TaxID=81408 RepID=A0A150LNI4_9BACL|nr:hypothetical protein B4119_1609 [Parageobacillus caldoxylosilyticus]
MHPHQVKAARVAKYILRKTVKCDWEIVEVDISYFFLFIYLAILTYFFILKKF